MPLGCSLRPTPSSPTPHFRKAEHSHLPAAVRSVTVAGREERGRRARGSRNACSRATRSAPSSLLSCDSRMPGPPMGAPPAPTFPVRDLDQALPGGPGRGDLRPRDGAREAAARYGLAGRRHAARAPSAFRDSSSMWGPRSLRGDSGHCLGLPSHEAGDSSYRRPGVLGTVPRRASHVGALGKRVIVPTTTGHCPPARTHPRPASARGGCGLCGVSRWPHLCHRRLVGP